MREQFPPVTINFARVNIAGWPGLMLVAIAVAIAFEFPETRWLFLSGLAAGAVVAWVLIARRAQHPLSATITRINGRAGRRTSSP